MQNDFKQRKAENIRVFVRIRPLNELEKQNNFVSTVNLNKEKNLIQMNRPGQCNGKQFTFSKIFDDKASQTDLYNCVAVPIVEKVFKGYNGTIFAYGQSGSGKTHTMIGHPIDTTLKGIVPNIFSQIFTEISIANKDISYVVTVTYLEIYNENVRDLLSPNPNQKLTVRERSDVGVYVKDLLGFTVNSLESATELLIRGNKNRITDSTKLNKSSSRSHAIFTILIETKDSSTQKTSFGKLNLVDLAGSERVHKTLATGNQLKEAGNINFSLSVLGSVISALVESKTVHVPYRNSKLTRLLQDSLGGNSLTTMIALISPSENDFEESVYTLMYADRVKHIKNFVGVNVEKINVIEKFENKIKELQQKLNYLLLKDNKKAKKTSSKTSSTSADELELEKIENEKSDLLGKIQTIQQKILIGGENLLEKAQEQKCQLDNTAEELKVLDDSHTQMVQILEWKCKEKNTVTENYSSLQEEDKDLDLKIAETEKLIEQCKELLIKKEFEYQNDISNLLFTNKCLAKEMGLVNFVVNEFIPKEYIAKIQSNLRLDEESQEWEIKGIAHSGNNIKRKKSQITSSISDCSKQVYFKY